MPSTASSLSLPTSIVSERVPALPLRPAVTSTSVAGSFSATLAGLSDRVIDGETGGV